MKASLEISLSLLDKFLLVVNTRKKAYVLILMWVLTAASYGTYRLFSIETMEYLLIHSKNSVSSQIYKTQAPIVPGI